MYWKLNGDAGSLLVRSSVPSPSKSIARDDMGTVDWNSYSNLTLFPARALRSMARSSRISGCAWLETRTLVDSVCPIIVVAVAVMRLSPGSSGTALATKVPAFTSAVRPLTTTPVLEGALIVPWTRTCRGATEAPSTGDTIESVRGEAVAAVMVVLARPL